jgi:AP2-associated kinase
LSSAHRPSSSASGMSWRTSPQPTARPSPSVQPEGLPAETRFPSLEDLDATYAPNPDHASRSIKPQVQQAPDTPALPPRNRKPSRSTPGTSEPPMKPTVQPRAYGADGVRSEQVTGIAMREPRPDTNDRRGGPGEGRTDGARRRAGSGSQSSNQSSLVPRPPLTRRHRSSITIKHTPPSIIEDVVPTSPLASLTVENLASKSPCLSAGSKDWLTGDDDLQHSSPSSVLVPTPPIETVVFRESPSKRASVTQKSTVPIQDAIFLQHDHTPSLKRTPSPPASASDVSPTISRFTRTFPPIDTTDHHQRDKATASTKDPTPIGTRTVRTTIEPESSSSADEGPEDVGGYRRTAVKAPASIGKPKRKGRQSSVHDLVDLWGGGIGHSEQNPQTPRPTSDDPETPLHEHKARPVASPLSSAKSNPNPKTPMLTPLGHDSRTRKAPSSNPRRSPTSGGTIPSTGSRSRPQSMIIYPSKSADAYTTLSSGHSSGSSSLVPPHNTNQRTSGRRTSISNMVQRYEGISGKGKSAGSIGPSSPATPRSAVKAGSLLTENGQVTKGQAQKGQVGLLPPMNDASHGQRSSSPIENARISPSPSRISPINPSSPLPHDGTTRGSENAVSRVPKLIFNREASKPVFTSVSKPVEEPSSGPGDEGSSSPERPYQGVGKLIDQWQRKTAEASGTRTAIGRGRGSAVGKRGLGVVHGISGRSQ